MGFGMAAGLKGFGLGLGLWLNSLIVRSELFAFWLASQARTPYAYHTNIADQRQPYLSSCTCLRQQLGEHPCWTSLLSKQGEERLWINPFEVETSHTSAFTLDLKVPGHQLLPTSAPVRAAELLEAAAGCRAWPRP